MYFLKILPPISMLLTLDISARFYFNKLSIFCDILLQTLLNSTDNFKVLSKPHGELSFENDQLYLTDKGSSNGTFVNNIRLTANCPTEIFHEDIIR